MPNLKKDSLEALIDLIVEMLPASSAEELVRTSKLTTPAIKEAQARISQGQSPYHVLTQLDSRDYGVDKQSRAVRALNEDYGPLSDPVHHGSGSGREPILEQPRPPRIESTRPSSKIPLFIQPC